MVAETLRQSLKIAEQLRQGYIQVTYNLDIAKVALQIQSTVKPTFYRVFIHLGSFHIIMAYFKAVGKCIKDSGFINVLVESQLLVNGSVTGLITGKSFNRCKRIYPLVYVGLEMLYFDVFLKEKELQIPKNLLHQLEQF